MTEQNQPTPKKSSFIPAFLLVLVVLLAGVGAYYFFNNKTETLTLNRYYPQSTRFFLEFAPGEKLTTAFLNFHKDKDPQAVMKQAMPQSTSRQQLTSEELNAEHSEFGKALAKNFDTLFEPHFGFGLWEAEATPETAADPAKMPEPLFLSAFPLKEKSQPITDVMTTLSLSPEEYTKQSYLGLEYQQAADTVNPPQKPAAMAIVDGDLLLASSDSAMKRAIEVVLKKQPKLLADDKITAGFSPLPADRDGILLVNAGDMVVNALKSNLSADVNKNQAQAFEKAEQLLSISPQLFATLHVDGQQVASNINIPMDLTQVKNEALQTAISDWLKREPIAFNAANSLPDNTHSLFASAHLDGLLNLVMDYGFSEKDKQGIKGAEFMLGMVQLDLKKDLIGLFSDEFVVAVPADKDDQKSVPVLVLSQTEAKQTTLDKMVKILSSGMLPVQHQSRQIGSVTLEAFKAKAALPGGNGQPPIDEVGIAPLNNSMVALGTVKSLTAVVEATDDNTKSLAKNDRFKAVASDLPSAGFSHWYVDGHQDKDQFVSASAGTLTHNGTKAITGKTVFQVNPEAFKTATKN